MAGPRILIAGATGLVGRQALIGALSDMGIAKVVAPTRRPLTDTDAFANYAGLIEENLLTGRLSNPIIDFKSPPESIFIGVTAVICAIGTTMRKAGSREAFQAIDHGLVLALATAARAANVPSFGYVSSVGAGPKATSFYLRVKAQVEADLAALGFNALTILRPSFLGGERDESRPMERIGMVVANALKWVTPKRYRVIDAADVAHRLITSAITPAGGVQIIESEKIPTP